MRLPITRQCTEDPRGEGTLTLRNLSGLVQARRKLKNFPTKTFTSRGDKKQLRVINPCQHPGPRGQARGPEGDQCALRMRNARGEIPGPQGAQLFHRRSGHGSPRRASRHLVGGRGSGFLPFPHSEAAGSWASGPPGTPVPPPPVFCKVAFFPEPSLGKFTEKEANHQGRRCKQPAASVF